MPNKDYNGWTNYETWRVNLEIIDDHINNGGLEDQTFKDKYELVEHLKEVTEDAISQYGELTDCLALDYARSFISEVNYYEIAEHAIEDNHDLIENDEEIS